MIFDHGNDKLDTKDVFLPNHLEPVPCQSCAAKDLEIAELRAELELAKLIIESEPKAKQPPKLLPPNAYHNCCE